MPSLWLKFSHGFQGFEILNKMINPGKLIDIYVHKYRFRKENKRQTINNFSTEFEAPTSKSGISKCVTSDHVPNRGISRFQAWFERTGKGFGYIGLVSSNSSILKEFGANNTWMLWTNGIIFGQ